jgi:hypothetical protein
VTSTQPSANRTQALTIGTLPSPVIKMDRIFFYGGACERSDLEFRVLIVCSHTHTNVPRAPYGHVGLAARPPDHIPNLAEPLCLVLVSGTYGNMCLFLV